MITDRYLYTLSWQNNSINVHPVEDNVQIEYEKLDYMAYLRPKMTGSLVFVNSAKDSIFDYNIFTTTPWWMVFTLEVFRGSRSNNPIYTGKFRIYDGSFDADRCTFTVTPEPYDDYSCLIYKGDDEINMITTTGDDYTVTHDSPEYGYESKTVNEWFTPATPLPTVVTLLSSNTSSPDYGFTLYFYARTYMPQQGGYLNHSEYRRDIAFTTTNVAPSSDWAALSGWDTSGGTYKWVRSYLNSINQTITNPYELHDNGKKFILTAESQPTSYSTSRCLRLNRMIEVFADNCGIGFDSIFFKGSTSYVWSNIGYYPPGIQSNVNPLSNIMMLQKSEISNQSDAATKGIMTFNTMMRLLYEMFNIQWFVNDNGNLQIEHISYFDNIAQGLDLTNSSYMEYIDAQNKWEYDFKNLKSERWKFMEAESTEFIGEPIDYTNDWTNMTMYRDAEIIEHNIDEITTDIEYAFSKPTEISNDGWFMFQTYYIPRPNKYVVGYEPSLYTQRFGYNMHLSLNNLHYYYWRHQRPFAYGQMNNQFTNFLTTEYIKIQTELTIPACDIDVNKLVKTEIGWGKVIAATEDFKTRTIKLTVAHRAGTQT